MRPLLRAPASVLNTPVGQTAAAVGRAVSSISAASAVSTLSVALCVVTVLLFAFSCFQTIEVVRRTTVYWPDGTVAGSGTHGVLIEAGAVTVGDSADVETYPRNTRWPGPPFPPPTPPPVHTTSHWSVDVRPPHAGGVSLWFSRTDYLVWMHMHVAEQKTVVVPLWLPAVLAGLLPATRIASRYAAARHRRASRAGLCPACGYDLRATPQRCPECGAVPKALIGEAAAPGPAGEGKGGATWNSPSP